MQGRIFVRRGDGHLLDMLSLGALRNPRREVR